MTYRQARVHKKVAILWHNGGRLANQLWLYISVFAYCAEEGYELHNYSFFEYAHYFNTQPPDKLARILLFQPYRFLWLLSSVFTRHPGRLSTYLFRKYYRALIAIFSLFIKKRTIRADPDSRPVYLPPSEGSYHRFMDFDTDENNSIYLMGWLFRNPTGIAKYHKEIVATFKPRKLYSDKAEDIVHTLRQQYKCIVGVHIRQGDYVRNYYNGELYFSEAEVNTFCMEMLQIYELPKSETCFVICSDGPIARKEFAPDLQIKVSDNSEIVDLLLLASCDYILGSNSTFAGFASYYGDKPLIVFQRTGIDWNHYRGRNHFFADPYLTSVHF